MLLLYLLLSLVLLLLLFLKQHLYLNRCSLKLVHYLLLQCFINKKDLRIGIAYDRVKDETTCSKINKKNRPSIVICSKRTKEMIDKYIDIIDEEFRNIAKRNALSYIV